jgi:hypothetical protein
VFAAVSDRDDFIAEAEKIRPLNTYHSGSGDASNLHQELAAAAAASHSSVSSSGGGTLRGYQQYLQQQQQLLQPPGQQHAHQQLPVDSWAGLMSESTLNNLEELLRSNSSSSHSSRDRSSSMDGPRRPSPGNWDEDWVGPSISDDDVQQPDRGWFLQRVNSWLRRRHKQKERQLRSHQREEEQLQVEQQYLQRAEQQEQDYDRKQHKRR